jgi:hypothetical protein
MFLVSQAWLGETMVRKDVIGTIFIVFGGVGIAVAYGVIGETKCEQQYEIR